MTVRDSFDGWCDEVRDTKPPAGFSQRVMAALPPDPIHRAAAPAAAGALGRAALIALATLGISIKAAAWLTPFIP